MPRLSTCWQRTALGLALLLLGTAPLLAQEGESGPSDPDPEAFGEAEDWPPKLPDALPSDPGAVDTSGEWYIDLSALFPDASNSFGWKRDQAASSSLSGDYLAQTNPLYTEYEAEEQQYLDYQKGEKWIRVELIRTHEPAGAFGLYSIFNAAALETLEPPPPSAPAPKPAPWDLDAKPAKELPPMHDENYLVYADGGGAEFFKAQVYGRVLVYGEVTDVEVLAFVHQILARIRKDAARPLILRELPRPGLVAGSERLLMGPVSALELDFVLPPDLPMLLEISNRAQGVTASYRYAQQGFDYDLLVVDYPKSSVTEARFKEIVAYLTMETTLVRYPSNDFDENTFAIFQDPATETFTGIQWAGTRLRVYSGIPNAPLVKFVVEQAKSLIVG